MPSNKLVRVLSSLSLGPEAKANCGCGAAGKRHFEDGDMEEVRRIEPENHPMILLFVKHLFRSICKVFNASGLPLALISARCQGPGTHPEYSTKNQTGDNVDSGPQGKTSMGEIERHREGQSLAKDGQLQTRQR